MGDGRSNSGERDQDLAVDTSAQAQGHRRILVVDDDRDVADGVAEVLRDCGHEVFVARDAVEALDRIAAVHPTVAIIDIGLPGVSGYELAIRARERQGRESLRLIALTGRSGAAERRESRDAGFDVHLTLVKPVNLDALLEAVSTGAAHF